MGTRAVVIQPINLHDHRGRLVAVLIPLSKGYFATIDAADYAEFGRLNWCASGVAGKMYAARSKRLASGRKTVVRMHNEMLPGTPLVDHRNGNGLDNRRRNIRPATARQNLYNMKKPSSGVTSRFKGVHRAADTGAWLAQIRYDGKHVHLGSFATEEEAAEAYRAASEMHHREFARH